MPKKGNTHISFLAKEWKSGAPLHLCTKFPLDVVERMYLNNSYALISEKAPLFASASG